MLVTRSLGLRNLESPGLSLQRPSAASCGADAAFPCPFATPEISASNKNKNAEKPNRMNRRITVSPFHKIMPCYKPTFEKSYSSPFELPFVKLFPKRKDFLRFFRIHFFYNESSLHP